MSLDIKVQDGSLVEVQFNTAFGEVLGLAEMLKPIKTAGAWIQQFRFVALGDDDYSKIRELVESDSLKKAFIRL